MAMLKVENLSIKYGSIEAVKNVSFEVNEGEVVTLIGANGAGKTSILRTISGLVRPTEGTISYLGNDIHKTPARKIVAEGLAQVPEGRHVFAGLTVMENLEMGAFLHTNKEENAALLKKVFQRFPRLEERKNQDAATLSGGEQQMLAMGRALMSRPKLLLLDEPSMGLAPIFIQEIFDIIEDIKAQGTTVLLIEQNANKALSIADRGYVLETGKVVLSGTGKELLASDEDFMTKRVVYVSPETTVAVAADIMREKGLRRLPVIEHDKLVGLVTEGTMAEASPSKATSLSIYEMNYLLNKTKVGDIMIKNVLTVSKYASLEDAIYIMLQNKVGVLPVVDNDQISGIITDKDVFRAFLEISGYGQAGIRIGLEVTDTPRVLEKIANLIASENLNIERTIVAPKNDTVLRVELQVEGEIGIEQLKKVFVEAGFTVTEIAETEAKELD